MSQNLKTIYIIDDQADILEILESKLTDNYKVKTFQNPIAALKTLKKDPSICDLIVIDFQMPEMTGSDFLQAMRADGLMLPIIFLTGHIDLELALTALRLGASDILSKPIDDQHFCDSIARVLNIESRKSKYYATEKTLRNRAPVLGLLQVHHSQEHKNRKSS